MSLQGSGSVEVFLQEASEHLQYLREYSGILQDSSPRAEELQRLYRSARALADSAGSRGYSLFSELAGKVAHVFQYAMNASVVPDVHGALAEFLSDALAVLESDLLQISSTGAETADDFAVFRERYAFAFQAPVAPVADSPPEPAVVATYADEIAAPGIPVVEDPLKDLPPDSEIPQEIQEFFVPEAGEHLQTATDCLLALEGSADPQDIHRLFRAMHTVKGSAAQVGLQRLSWVAHHVEDLIGRLRDGAVRPTAGVIDVCLESVDALKRFVHREWNSEEEMRVALESLLPRIAELKGEERPAAEVLGAAEASQEGVLSSSASGAVGEPGPAAAHRAHAAGPPQPKSIRISLDRLDRMMNAVGELVINRTRMLGRLAELERLVDVLNFSKGRLHGKVAEFQEKHEFNRLSPAYLTTRLQMGTFGSGKRDVVPPAPSPFADFTDLEMDRYDDFNILSRSLAEISADVTEVLTQLDSFLGRVDADIDEFTKLAHHLQDEITQARMVPIGNLYSRLTRTVRDACKAMGRPVDLVLQGADTQLDNNIIQQISDPLIHLVRNAVAHGIGSPEERGSVGKTARGRIAVRAYHRGNHIFIEVEDDGKGIDYDKVRSRATEAGLVSPEEAGRLTERELRSFLFRPGFSTASSQNELAGRGVGLDVVRANLHALNGEIEVETQQGLGTCFTMKVPLTLIISQALFVRCGASLFAFPLAVVEEIRRLRTTEIEEVGGKLLTKVRDVVTEVLRLDAQLGLDPIEPVNDYFRMVIVNVAGRQAGIVVEEVLGKDEIVIKSLGEYLRNVKLFPGTTIASDGSLILLLDLNRLVSAGAMERRGLAGSASAARVFAPGSAAVAAGTIPAEAIDSVGDEKVVVVADDSISVRKFVGRMLEKAGYRVQLASDGLEALELISHAGCHLVITDLEMPRMNGYELMAGLRQNSATRNIPVLVVTSRAGAKHRDRAMKDGASAFLTKPVQEDQLLATVAQLTGAEAGSTRPAPVNPAR